MRAVVAKRIKKSIYGDFSTKGQRKYLRAYNYGQIVCDGKRAEYLDAKRLYKERKHNVKA
jgi:hypothetical protein